MATKTITAECHDIRIKAPDIIYMEELVSEQYAKIVPFMVNTSKKSEEYIEDENDDDTEKWDD
jgi:hypothetical protein